MKRTIHSTAIVSPRAELGEGVIIGPYSIIEDEVCIGENTVIGAYVRVLNFVEIGEMCIRDSPKGSSWEWLLPKKPPQNIYASFGKRDLLKS